MEIITGVRPMTGRDVEEVVRLEQACFSQSWSEYLIRSGLNSKLDAYFVYQGADGILGYSVLRVLSEEGEIQRIAVYPDFRRCGIGRELMDAMVSFSRRAGVREIALEVRESNGGARKLYESYGFWPEAIRRGYYHNPQEDAVIMWNRNI